MRSKPTLKPFIVALVSVVVREKVFPPRDLNTMIYVVLYDVLSLWIYNDSNMTARPEKFPTLTEFFFTSPS